MPRNHHQIMTLLAVDVIEYLFLTYKEPHLLFLIKEPLLENPVLLTVNKEQFHFLLYLYHVHCTSGLILK